MNQSSAVLQRKLQLTWNFFKSRDIFYIYFSQGEFTPEFGIANNTSYWNLFYNIFKEFHSLMFNAQNDGILVRIKIMNGY